MKVETITTYRLTDDDGGQFILPLKPTHYTDYRITQTPTGWAVVYAMDDVVYYGESYWDDRDYAKFFDLKDSKESEAVKRLGADWTLFSVDKYEHSLVSYKLAGSFSCPWDTSTNRYLLAVRKDAGQADKLAEALLKEYTDWCNGETYCAVEAQYDKDRNILDYEVCGGYIGLESVLAN